MKYLVIFFVFLTISCTNKKAEERNQVINSEKKQITSEETPLSSTTVISDSIYKSEISVTGVRTINSVCKEVERHLISINYWYNRDFKSPTKEEVTVKFSINALGVAHSPSLIHSTLHDSSFVNRILKDIPRWRFARFDDGTGETEVVYPISLTPAKKLEL